MLATDTGSGKSGLLFAIETSGTLVANPSGLAADVTLPGPASLDLRLCLDPAARCVTAEYRVDSSDAAGWQILGFADATAYPVLANFFKLGAAAGILASANVTSPFALPTTISASMPPPRLPR